MRAATTRGAVRQNAPHMTAVIVGVGARVDAVDMSTPHTPRRVPAPFARLRAEHARVLDRLDASERTLTDPSALDESTFLAMARDLKEALDLCFAVEGAVLFPALIQQLPELALALEALLDDHVEFRDMTRSFAVLLEQANAPNRAEQLVVLGRDLTDLLRLHIHKQERLILNWSERVLPAPVLAEVGAGLSLSPNTRGANRCTSTCTSRPANSAGSR